MRKMKEHNKSGIGIGEKSRENGELNDQIKNKAIGVGVGKRGVEEKRAL